MAPVQNNEVIDLCDSESEEGETVAVQNNKASGIVSPEEEDKASEEEETEAAALEDEAAEADPEDIEEVVNNLADNAPTMQVCQVYWGGSSQFE